MPTPSLILVPARFKTGKLYTPVATTSGGVVLGASGDFNVTRATTATRVNASGLIEVVASGVPRLDYYTSGGTAGCPALLVEPAATNFARGVELLNTPTPATAAGGITITTGSTDFLAPDGTSGTITKYVGGTASGANFIEYASSTSVSAAGVHTFSAFVKAGATNPLNFCGLQFTAFAGGSGTGTSYFSLASGTALTSGASIQDYGNGWYRIISAPYTIAAGDLAGDIRLLFAEANNDASFPASGALNLTLYAWGIQLEAGSVATSYIPTTTASVTRNADVISVTGAVSGCIGQTEGTIYVEIIAPIEGTGVNAFFVGDGTSSDFLYLGKNAGNLGGVIRSGGQTRFANTSFALTGSAIKAALGYKSGDYALYANGSIVASGTTAFTFTNGLTTIGLVSNQNFAAPATINKYNAVALYTTRLTNTELAALTTL